MRTIIAGSRQLKYPTTLIALRQCPWTAQISVVLSGCSRGPDTHGLLWAKLKGIPAERYPANWIDFGPAAGPIRNELMASKAEALLLVWTGVSRGSADMLAKAKLYNLRIFEFLVNETGV